MPVTVEELGQRVLRRLGLALVAGSERADTGSAVSLYEVARQALRVVGVNPAPPYANSGTVGPLLMATRVLRRIGVVDANEAPETADTNLVGDKVRDANQILLALGIGNWSVDFIPEYVAEPLEIMVASLAASSYGKQGNPDAYAQALNDIRAMALSGTRGQEIAEQKARQAFGMVVAAGVADWGADATPAYMAPALVQLTANLLAPVYGKPAEPADTIMQSMRQTLLLGPRGLQIAAEKVRAVHADLVARRRTRWLLNDIPTAAEEPYVMMAAVLMAPIASVRVDPNDWALGDRMITKIVALPSTGEVVVGQYF